MPHKDDQQSLPATRSFGIPPWMEKMRQAAADCITVDDVKAIVQAQVEKAKQGDEKAMKFVFEQVLGGGAFKGASFTQHVYQTDPATPTSTLPGTSGKLETMAARAAAGKPLHDPHDARRNVD